MPIYAYKCSSCGTSKDILRKLSDPPLTLCPACGKNTLDKQVTASSFQLKGSGWYVTDFREGSAKPDATPAAEKSTADQPSVSSGAAGAASAASPANTPAVAATGASPPSTPPPSTSGATP